MFRYTPGKMDWFASAGPRAGREASLPRAADAARSDVPTCRLHERCGDVAARVRGVGWELCVVVDDDRVVLGVLDSNALARDGSALVEDTMQAGPTTVRPHLRLQDVVESLKSRQRERILITTSDGRLVGLLWRADAERYLTRAA